MPLNSSSYPFDTVVYITDDIDGQTWQGSGVLISPDEVLTASHVVYNSAYGPASDITVIPAYNDGTEPFGEATGTYIHYFQIQDANDLIAEQQSQNDYAVIHLSNSFTGLGTMGLESNFQGGYVNVAGYPGALNGVMDNSKQYVTVDHNYTLLDGTSIGKGSSGGPVWIDESGGESYVVGVVSSEVGGTGSTGYFTEITASAFNQIEQWVSEDTSPSSEPINLTNGGTAYVLLQSGGTVADWIVQNGQYAGGNILSTAAAGWNVVGAADFAGNGTPDVLLQNGGTVADWIMQNGQYAGGNILSTAAAGWTVVGSGDFTGDGTDDVLLQNGGTLVDWIMQNGQYQSGNALTTAGSGWTVAGTGDFTGNGTDDVLLQNGGTVVDWIMKDGAYQSGNVLTTAAAGWTVVGTGDYTGDGTCDVLLQSGATVVDWMMKNGAYQSGNVLTNAASGWQVARS
jgi:V8-like Glu-specific endopeptidase